MKSTEGFSELPEDKSEESFQSPAGGSPSATLAASTDRVTEEARYSTDDFASVSASATDSNKWSASGSDNRKSLRELSDPNLSPISYTDSDDQGRSDMMNIKSLSELGSSVDDLVSSNNLWMCPSIVDSTSFRPIDKLILVIAFSLLLVLVRTL